MVEHTPTPLHRGIGNDANEDLLSLLNRYIADHDQRRWPQDRPCDCDLCRQAREAIAKAKRGTYVDT